MSAFNITEPQGNAVPIIVSMPHCGTDFPSDLRSQFKPELLEDLDDTDWFVQQLYDFAPSMGMTMIHAVYHRWVIDLNRDPRSKPLYNDGRLITGLCPTTDFRGENLYKDERPEVSEEEISERMEKYFSPYHNALNELIERMTARFGKVLLWDCHSIRQTVPTIHSVAFPDLILGDNDGNSCDGLVADVARKNLEHGNWSFRNNFLFKGGYITRHYGKPEQGQHALQLEMTKVNYMDDSQRKYDEERAAKMRRHLQQTFRNLITILTA